MPRKPNNASFQRRLTPNNVSDKVDVLLIISSPWEFSSKTSDNNRRYREANATIRAWIVENPLHNKGCNVYDHEKTKNYAILKQELKCRIISPVIPFNFHCTA